MNANQKKVLTFGLLAFVWVGLFPPQSMEFIFGYRNSIDFPALFIIWAVITVGTAGLVAVAGRTT